MHILTLNDLTLLKNIQTELLTKWFPKPVDYYCKLPLDTYRSLVELAQGVLNSMDVAHLLANDVKAQLFEILQTKHIMVQTGLYLRASRPVEGVRHESVGWHRESFYGANEYEYNFWCPIHGVTPENSPLYIPGSDKIPDSEIKAVLGETDETIKSAQIGLIRTPLVIAGGVDMTKTEPFRVPQGSVAVFPGSLIHGAAKNTTKAIRMSVDFRMVAKEHIAPQRAGEHYYVDLQ
jgi:ectoine hydroxylase-related dioxygenase (phytanoyl-CoA dioxygenase family)